MNKHTLVLYMLILKTYVSLRMQRYNSTNLRSFLCVVVTARPSVITCPSDQMLVSGRVSTPRWTEPTFQGHRTIRATSVSGGRSQSKNDDDDDDNNDDDDNDYNDDDNDDDNDDNDINDNDDNDDDDNDINDNDINNDDNDDDNDINDNDDDDNDDNDDDDDDDDNYY